MSDKKQALGPREIKRLLLAVYRKHRAGELTDTGAYRQTYILNSLLKAIELTDLEDRLQAIEEKLSD